MSWRGLLSGLPGVAAFALTLPLTRIAVLATSSLDVFAIRLLLASAAAVVVLLLLRVPVPPREHWLSVLLVCAGVVFGFPLFTSLAMSSAASAHGGVVLGILPLATAVATAYLNRERPSGAFWLTALLGSSLVVIFALMSGAGRVSAGDLWLLLAIAAAAIGYAVGGQLSRVMPAWQVISWSLAIALPDALLLVWFLEVPLTPWFTGAAQLPAQVIGSMLYLGLISQYGGFLLWYRALAIDGVAHTSQLQLLQPFITLFAAAWLVGEVIELTTIAFALLIVAVVLLSRRAPVESAA